MDLGALGAAGFVYDPRSTNHLKAEAKLKRYDNMSAIAVKDRLVQRCEQEFYAT